ncbi:LysR family transcriptional regulator [Hypericibacter sp.]|uniref:LysR family transcriptional regulator n=1 Tax=Hypericibacter sp. TaxID=2705401 RepID=UPI003D6CBEBD
MLLRQLEYLVTLARERHFGRAAAVCHVTQPTLSAAIRELESELGVLIVERGQRFRGLTPEGERIVEWAHRIIADRDAMHQELALLKEGLSGHLTIGVIPTALAALGLLTTPFRATHPRVQIKILSMSSIEIQRGLDNFDIDAALTYLDNEPLLRVRSHPLYHERYYLVTGDPDLFATRRSVTWAEAAKVPLCLLTPDMQNRRIVDHAFHEAGATPTPVVESNSILGLYTHVRSGLAAVLSQASLHLLGEPNWLRALPLTDPKPERLIGVVYPEREPLQPTARALVEVAQTLDIEAALASIGPPRS